MRNLLDWEYAVAQSEAMRIFGNLGTIVRAGPALVLVLGVALGAPSRAQASILAGCVGTDDTTAPGVVGWVDVGLMLGMADPEPPVSLQVTDPNGNVIDYRDGVGLIPPTDVLPIWFASVEQQGDYGLVVDGEEHCTITVSVGSDDTLTSLEAIIRDWVPRSALVMSGLK